MKKPSDKKCCGETPLREIAEVHENALRSAKRRVARLYSDRSYSTVKKIRDERKVS